MQQAFDARPHVLPKGKLSNTIFTNVGKMINGISDDHNFKVHIPIVYRGLLNLTQRIRQWNDIREWIDELVEWVPESYSVQHDARYIDIWFKESKHAMMCQLRWGS